MIGRGRPRSVTIAKWHYVIVVTLMKDHQRVISRKYVLLYVKNEMYKIYGLVTSNLPQHKQDTRCRWALFEIQRSTNRRRSAKIYFAVFSPYHIFLSHQSISNWYFHKQRLSRRRQGFHDFSLGSISCVFFVSKNKTWHKFPVFLKA